MTTLTHCRIVAIDLALIFHPAVNVLHTDLLYMNLIDPIT
jgi:hypothetical protein